MPGGQELCIDPIGKHIVAPQRRHRVVKPADLRQSPAQHNRLRIQYVDNAGQGAGQTSFVTLQGRLGNRITGHRRSSDYRDTIGFTTVQPVITHQPGTGQPGFDTTMLSTIAGRSRQLAITGPGQRIMTPLTGNAIRTTEQLATNHDTATHASPENHAKD